MIQPGEIARLAHRLSLGDKTIEKDYVLTWTLLAIAESPLRNRLAFKGGTALKKVYVPDSVDHRFHRRRMDIGFDERDHAVDGFDGSAQKASQALQFESTGSEVAVPMLDHLTKALAQFLPWIDQGETQANQQEA